MKVVEKRNVDAPPRRRRRRYILTTLLLVLVSATAVATWLYRKYTSSEYIRASVVAVIEKTIGLPTSVGGSEFSFFRGIVLKDLRIEVARAENRRTGQPPLLQVGRIEIEHDPMSLLFGRLHVRRVAIEAPLVNLLADPDERLADLRFPRRRDDTEDPIRLPALDIQHARLNLFTHETGMLQPAVSLPLSIRGHQNDGMYDVVWQRDDRPESGRVQIDFQRAIIRHVDGGTPWLSAEMIAAATQFHGAVDEWMERLGVRGEVRARDFVIPLGDDSEASIRAVFELRDAFASIPAAPEENEIDPAERYLRFDELAAEVDATRDRIHATAEGSFNGSPVALGFELDGGLKDLPLAAELGFHVELTARDVRLPRRGDGAPDDEARFVLLAPRLSKFYDDYEPEAVFDAQLWLSRPPGADQRIALERGLFTAKGGNVYTRYFPYPCENVSGEVEVNRKGLFIREMCGTHRGGQACMNAWFEGTKRCAATTIEVVAEGIPIDDELFTALGPNRAWIREQFHPAGRADATVLNYRPSCDPEKPARWTSEIDVFPQGVSARYTALPYPVDGLAGRIEIRDDTFSIDLGGRAGPAPVSVTGHATIDDRNLQDLNLEVAAFGLPLDEQFVIALPPDTSREVAAFHPTGAADVNAYIFADPENGRLSHRTVLTLNSATIQHETLPLPIHDLTGEIVVIPGRVELSNVTGRYKDAQIAASGVLPNKSTTDEHGNQLIVGIQNLTLDGHVLAAVPPQLQSALDTWQVGGAIDARITVDRPGPADELAFRGEVRLGGNTVQPAFMPNHFHEVRAIIQFEPGRVGANDVQARYGDADVMATFAIQTPSPQDGASRGAVKLLATNLSANAELIGLLPPAAQTTVRRMGASGRIDIELERLSFLKKGPDVRPVWSVDGGVRFADLSLPAIGGLRRVVGTATVSGLAVDAQGGTSLSGDLRLNHASLFERDLLDLTTPWTLARTAQGEGYLAMDRIDARVYDGELNGRTELQFSPERSEYSVTTTIQGMQLASFINSGRRSPEELDARGIVNANLYLTGEVGQLHSLRGGGRFEIVNGWLYKLPIILAILNVLDLTAQPGDAFDEAAADFYIVGDRVSFRDIVVKGGVLALVGEGILAIPDLAVDLRLVNVPSQWWARLPVLEDLMKGTVREFVEIRVSGPVTQPSVKTQPVPHLTDEIKRLFERRKTRHVVDPE